MPEFDSTIQYRDIPEHPGYRVGSDGSVWSCWTGFYPTGQGRVGCVWFLGESWRRLSEADKGGGYMVVNLRRMKRVPRLVLEAFVGPCPPDMEACHNDGDPTNNALTNLRWDTRRGNMADKRKHGTHNGGEANPAAKLTEAQVQAIRVEYAAAKHNLKKLPNGRAMAIAAKYGIHPCHMGKIIRGDQWRQDQEQ